jgi:hypothetical protein
MRKARPDGKAKRQRALTKARNACSFLCFSEITLASPKHAAIRGAF